MVKKKSLGLEVLSEVEVTTDSGEHETGPRIAHSVVAAIKREMLTEHEKGEKLKRLNQIVNNSGSLGKSTMAGCISFFFSHFLDGYSMEDMRRVFEDKRNLFDLHYKMGKSIFWTPRITYARVAVLEWVDIASRRNELMEKGLAVNQGHVVGHRQQPYMIDICKDSLYGRQYHATIGPQCGGDIRCVAGGRRLAECMVFFVHKVELVLFTNTMELTVSAICGVRNGRGRKKCLAVGHLVVALWVGFFGYLWVMHELLSLQVDESKSNTGDGGGVHHMKVVSMHLVEWKGHTGIFVDESWTEQPEEMKEGIVKYFEETRTLKRVSTKVLNKEHIRKSDVMFIEDKVKDAIWECSSDRSLGPNDYNFGFFKQFWDLLKNDILKMMVEFYLNGRLQRG
ncbi:hypothetical protein Fmac_024621 [Flemingia macrophylla]|uniref:Uncharacterized protein n=1 Tax=Flemingia macrophylla TaxID=520843 RepID=A0ABD1LQG1_9FABA